MRQNRAGLDVGVIMAEYVTTYSQWLVTLTCGIGVVDDRAPSSQAFEAYLPVFTQIANSLVIHNQWAISKPSSRRK